MIWLLRVRLTPNDPWNRFGIYQHHHQARLAARIAHHSGYQTQVTREPAAEFVTTGRARA